MKRKKEQKKKSNWIKEVKKQRMKEWKKYMKWLKVKSELNMEESKYTSHSYLLL